MTRCEAHAKPIPCRDCECESLAAALHRVFCGCAASDPEGDAYLWCDGIWLVLAERVAPTIRECAADMGAIHREHVL